MIKYFLHICKQTADQIELKFIWMKISLIEF